MNGNRGAIQELFSPFSPMYEGFFPSVNTSVITDTPNVNGLTSGIVSTFQSIGGSSPSSRQSVTDATNNLKYYVYDSILVYGLDIVVYNPSGDDLSGNYFKSKTDTNSQALDNSSAWAQIPVYASDITYANNDLVSVVDNSEEKLYRSLNDANTGNQVTDTHNWENISSGSPIHAVDKLRLVNIHSRYLDISGNIKTYGTIYEDISNNYDYGKPDEFPEFAEITRDDVLNQDLQFLMAQQKNTHMIGMIAIATLAVGIFYIARNFRTDTE